MLDHVIAVNVRAVKDSKIFPLTPRSPFDILDNANDIWSLRIFAAKRDGFDRKSGQGASFLSRVFFTSGLQRSAAVGERPRLVVCKYRRILVDNGKRTLQDRSGRAPILVENYQFRLRKMPPEHLKCGAGCAPKAVDALIRVTDSEDVACSARERGENLNLREVGVLKFVDQNKTRTSAFPG